jgi:hypothetical protein
MLIKIGAALIVITQYIQRRGQTDQFCMRIPAHLHKHYGKNRVRQSLNTKDDHSAVREAEKLARTYQAEFKVLTDGAKAIPADTALVGKSLAGQYDLDTFIDHVIEPHFNQIYCKDEASMAHRILSLSKFAA